MASWIQKENSAAPKAVGNAEGQAVVPVLVAESAAPATSQKPKNSAQLQEALPADSRRKLTEGPLHGDSAQSAGGTTNNWGGVILGAQPQSRNATTQTGVLAESF